MPSPLKRILRIRHLAEEQARLELERETQRLRQAQAARIHAEAQVHIQREQLASSFVTSEEEGIDRPADILSENSKTSDNFKTSDNVKIQPMESDWLLAEAALEFSSWNQMQLEQWCIQEAERVAPLAEQYQQRRKELRQVERLVESQTQAEHVVQDRRDQSEADSWFQIETLRRERNERK